jgi:hypothetical protein
MADVFTRILRIELPESLQCDESGKNPAFTIAFVADGLVPFPQIILHTSEGQRLITREALEETVVEGDYEYTTTVPAGLLWPSTITVQAEGCRKADIQQAGGSDWIKEFRQLRIAPNAKAQPVIRVATGPGNTPVKLYFGIHKHMHQPYYNATDRNYWDGEKDSIFGSRRAPIRISSPTPCANMSMAVCPMPGCPPVGAAR